MRRWWRAGSLARALVFGGLSLAAAVPSGCVIDEDIEDGTREMRGGLTSLVIEPGAEGQAVVKFSFTYLLGLVDEAGIAPLDWVVTVRTRDQQVLGRLEQVMREPSPDQTKLLVVGERKRELPVPAAALRPGEGYILWFEMTYRDERLAEFLLPIYAISGEQIAEPYDPESEL